MNPRIFISYRDSAAKYAADICNWLRSVGFSFIDIRGIDCSGSFAWVIERAFSRCDVLFALIDTHWFRDWVRVKGLIGHPDDFVRLEIAAGLECGIPVVAILLPGAAMPSSEELPPDIAPLARLEALDATDEDFYPKIERLLKVMADSNMRRAQRNRLRADSP